jgi:hypothetical protein
MTTLSQTVKEMREAIKAVHNLQDRYCRCPGTRTRQRRLGREIKTAYENLHTLQLSLSTRMR